MTIEAMLATMPLCTYGQVVIESDDEIAPLNLPRRVQVRRVGVRRSITGDAITGEAVARAADAWLGEWMPGEHETRSSLFAWIGCEGSIAAADAADRLDHSLRAGLAGS
ncbi:hypothetical protein DDQ50_15895 [Amnibacterium flavum]|uniref:Uncharacterized protein n=1 Tax=Amnibacterium flavum TaxID=2173173 RepID=A0A2V1HLC1_9MICO|nr:hypothetical protein DDQ50_15895 [Amnibacterium flavum]